MENLDAVVPIRSPVIEEPISIAEVGELGRKIKASYQMAAAHVLTTAELCYQGFARWGSRGLPLLLRTAQMSKTTFMKFVVIGRDQRLRRIEGMLPPGFSIIYEVSAAAMKCSMRQSRPKSFTLTCGEPKSKLCASQAPARSSKIATFNHL